MLTTMPGASLVLVSLLLAPPSAAEAVAETVEIRLRSPAPEPRPAPRERELGERPVAAPGPLEYGDDAVPNPIDSFTPPPSERKVGSNITVFVNFDGVHIGACSPSNSHRNCHWLDNDTTFDPYSGSLAQRVAILDAMRSLVDEFGIRVTGQRPPDDETYVMVVYGGDSEEEEALGRAPSGDCWDDLPNEIAYAYMDGVRADWINGGASTALHEAAHTWGFDHIGLEGSLMAPAGDNTMNRFFDGCGRIVSDVDLTPATDPSCPQLNLELCGLEGYQYDTALLRMLFGQPYVDTQAPELVLERPFDGAYFQTPSAFRVEIAVIDDLHPQVYQVAITVPGLVDEAEFQPALEPSFDVGSLPLGTWTFEVRVRDEAGNEGMLRFDVEIGEDAMQLDDGCACTSSPSPALPWLLLPFAPLLLRRPRSRARA